MPYRFYYSDALTNDTEGNLVQLCDRCAQLHADQVEWAGDAAEGCELCDGDAPADDAAPSPWLITAFSLPIA